MLTFQLQLAVYLTQKANGKENTRVLPVALLISKGEFYNV